jgi:hypothetical protein
LDSGGIKRLKERRSKMKINRIWAMPNKNTFEIKPIRELVQLYYCNNSIDPFANKNKIATITKELTRLSNEYGRRITHLPYGTTIAELEYELQKVNTMGY